MAISETILGYFIWNGNPELFSVGFFSLRWYGLLFALGFLISQQLLFYIHKMEGKPEKDVETLTIVMIVATIIGARLGHVIFYQPEMLWEQPWAVFIPFGFSSIQFTAFTAKSMLGTLLPVAAIVWIYLEVKKKPKAEWVGYSIMGIVLLLVVMRFALKQNISDFFPVELVNFRFTGFEGLASHGGAFAILLALWLYSRKNKPGQSYLQVLDRIVILVFLTGSLIRLGNYFNSEIIGKPTNSPLGVLFVSKLTNPIEEAGKGTITSLAYRKDKNVQVSETGRVPVNLYLFFDKSVSQPAAHDFINRTVKDAFFSSSVSEFFAQIGPLDYQLVNESDGTLAARIKTIGIVRHPSQLYESISCFLLFALFWWYWSKHKNNLAEGRIFGWFMVILWGLRFAYEFLKENQVLFENSMTFNMGQLLSVPLFLVGVWVLIRSYRKPISQS
jgi:prolipoprotein diacylglyceryltransferase